jgi:hypothetical protein
MYAQKESLAIDGKAMYFRGRWQASAFGLRPSDANPPPRISRIRQSSMNILIRGNQRNPWLIFLMSEV